MNCSNYPRPHKRLIDERIARNDAINFNFRDLLIDTQCPDFILIPLMNPDYTPNDAFDPTPLDLIALLELRMLIIDAEIAYHFPYDAMNINPLNRPNDAYPPMTFRIPQTELMTEYRLSDSLCPLHHCDYAACFDDDDPECAAIRLIHPSHDT